MITSIPYLRAKIIFPRIPHIHFVTAKLGHNLGFLSIFGVSLKKYVKNIIYQMQRLYIYIEKPMIIVLTKICKEPFLPFREVHISAVKFQNCVFVQRVSRFGPDLEIYCA